MNLAELLNRDIVCTCGRTHRCDIRRISIKEGALNTLPELVEETHVLLAADENTWNVCGEAVTSLLKEKVESVCIFRREDHLIPNEESIEELRGHLTEHTDLILGIGSGVINDLCKYVSWYGEIPCGIVATAPSMDGYASSGAAMILRGMKVTETTHAPDLIVGDVDILKNAPMEMIRSGYADIIGKYSALNDWKLSELINGEYLCPVVYDLVKEKTDAIRNSARALTLRDADAIRELMETLVLIGACLTLLATTRPGSGSEHHLSHYFEITGLIDHAPYFLHGTDVGYATVVTARLREEICKIDQPRFSGLTERERERCYKEIYKDFWPEVRKIQREAKRYAVPVYHRYTEHWPEVREILSQCPAAAEIETMLTDVGFDLSAFEKTYGKEKIQNGIWFGKDLKDRYSVLWLYYDLFIGERKKTAVNEATFDFMQASVKAEERALAALHTQMDRKSYEETLQYILNSNLVVTTACGSSGFAAKKFAHSLCCVNKPGKFVPPSEGVHGGMGALQPGNLLILVSKGGKSEELIPMMEIAKSKGCKTAVITAKPESLLAKQADAVLLLPDVPESDRYQVMSTASFAATVAIFDALMMGVMEETGYTDRDFALIHPGGAVGKQLCDKE